MTTNPANSPHLEALIAKARKRHPCAVCPTIIGLGFLMCPRHWRLVPHDQQREVYRTWNRYQSVTKSADVASRDEYFAARDRAIDSARAAMHQPTGGAR